MPENAYRVLRWYLHEQYQNSGKRGASQRRFYLIAPKPNVNVGELAGKLIGLKTVEEVFLSEGAYGFIVKVRCLKGRAANEEWQDT